MHSQQTQMYLFALATTLIFSMTIFLAREWIKVRQYAYELLELKQDYQAYVQMLRRRIPEQLQDDTCTFSYEDILINREFTYLRDAALTYATFADIKLDQQMLPIYEPYDFGLNTQEKEAVAPSKSASRSVIAKRAAPACKSTRAQSLMCWPLEKGSFWLSSLFGPRKKPDGSPGFHLGIDLAAVRGTKIKAAAAGMVVEAGHVRGYGNTIVIVHNRKYKTRYAHLDKIMVKRNQKIDREQIIGTVGNTGLVRSDAGGDPSHLHFEVYVFGKRVNPRNFLP